MEPNTQGTVKSLKFFLRAFWICLAATIAFHIGAEAAKGPMSECASREWRVPNGLSALFVFTTGILLVIIIIMFLSLGKKRTGKSNDALDRLDKLGKLKEQGTITQEEFEREKKKILEEK